MLDVLLDAFLDTLKTLPFLFGAYLLIEFLEHKASDKLTGALSRMGPLGPLGGAALGLVPQCGFSVAAANFYAGRLISAGTLGLQCSWPPATRPCPSCSPGLRLSLFS